MTHSLFFYFTFFTKSYLYLFIYKKTNITFAFRNTFINLGKSVLHCFYKSQKIKNDIMRLRIVNILLALAFVCPSISPAQVAVEVDRSKYPDYSSEINPDYSLMKPMGGINTRSANAAKRPEYVNNAETRHFPPVFNQDGGSCGSASRICYMFSYELAAYRDLDGSKAENYYPSHFVWLHTNSPGSQGKDHFVQSVGVPSAATYGGQTYSSLFGNQAESDNDFGWMQGYDKWYEAMHNRMLKPTNFPKTLGTEEGREAVKNWLWNHNGDDSFKSGGICGIGVASGGEWAKIKSTDVNDKIGVTNKYYVQRWGETVDHALTIVGYDDRIEFDLDNNGKFGEADKDERGAWIIVNSWGEWCNNGFIYCPYAYAGPAFRKTDSGGYGFKGEFWAPEVYHVRKDYRPLRTIKLEMEYTRRSEIALVAGISDDINAEEPDATIPFVHFTYAGDGNYGNSNPAPKVPMLGRWADGELHSEPMEFGYDLTDLSANYDKNKPLKYFFIIEQRSWAQGSGKIHKASIIDYEYDKEGIETPFDLGENGVRIKTNGNRTIISVVVNGSSYYAPQNVSFADSRLSWQPPVRSSNTVESYNIYFDGTLIANVPANKSTYTPENVATSGEYGVSAVYADGNESTITKVILPVSTQTPNKGVNFNYSGFSIPNVFNTKFQQATIEYWIKPTILEYYNQSFGPGWGNGFMFHSGWGGSIQFGWNYANDHLCETKYNVLNVGQWAHVAVVVDNNKIKLYVNGVEKGNVESSEYSGIGGFGDLVFSSSSYHEQNAVYDEIRIWNKALTQEQINAAKNIEYSGYVLPNNLLAYFKGDMITGADGIERLRDCVGGNHATFLNNQYSIVSNNLPTLGTSKDAPTVSINAPQDDIFAGIPVDFTATYNSSVNKLEWTVANAGIAGLSTASPSVTFPTAGTYTIEVKATATGGEVATATYNVEVLATPEIDASFIMTADIIPAGERVSFLANNPTPGYIYEWNLPGAEKEYLKATSVGTVYSDYGDYTVELTVTAPDGKKKTSSKTITIMEVAPKASFNISPAVVLKGEAFDLTDESLYNPLEWSWILGSNELKYLVFASDTTMVLNEPGVYDVTLNVANGEGKSKLTRERALIVCNADSKNGLNFGNGSGSITTTDVPFEPGEETFTIDWWMNAAWPTSSCNGIGDSESTMILRTNSDKSMSLFIGDEVVMSAADYVIPDEWHHYAVTYNAGTVKFYRDAEVFSSKTHTVNSVPEMNSFNIGGTSAPFCGSIDEFRVWNIVLSRLKLRSIVNAPLSNVQSDGLLIYYQFNQTGGNVQDATLNGNHGIRNNFGPDGDAWGLSKGVFSLNFAGKQSSDVSATYLKNYRANFQYNSNECVNPALSTRTFALKDWTLENTMVSGNTITGAHVDTEKNYCFTVTTGWDNFATTLSNHKVYQTIELPAGYYYFEVTYDNTYEGTCGGSYMVAALGETLPINDDLKESIAYKAMVPKGQGNNILEFYLLENSTVSLGLLVNMSGQSCMAIQSFALRYQKLEVIEPDDATGILLPQASDNVQETIIYDLQGRRVTKMQRGVYIINGKKVVR